MPAAQRLCPMASAFHHPGKTGTDSSRDIVRGHSPCWGGVSLLPRGLSWTPPGGLQIRRFQWGPRELNFSRNFYVVLCHSKACELPAPSDSREKAALTGEEGMSEVTHVTGEGK